MHREYPHIKFAKQWNIDSRKLSMLLGECHAYEEAIINTPILKNHYEELMNVALIKGAQATTAIEGNTLSDEEIKKLIDGQKLPPSRKYQQQEVSNVYAALNSLLAEIIKDQTDHFISVDLLLRFHQMIGKDLGEHFSAIPGQIRNSDVVVGRYRCPDYRDVPELLEKLCSWIKEEFKYGQKKQRFSDVLIQAIVTHIYIEWIHPFGDGNGRMGRLVEFYILLRGGSPDIASHILSNHYNLTRTEYYRQIEKATEKQDLTEFIEYALLGFRDGLVQTLRSIQDSQFKITWKNFIYDTFEKIRGTYKGEDVFKRQRVLALEIPMYEEFLLSEIPTLTVQLAGYYSPNMPDNLSQKTLSRDVEKLIELAVIKKTEDNKYIANVDSIRGMIAKRKNIDFADEF